MFKTSMLYKLRAITDIHECSYYCTIILYGRAGGKDKMVWFQEVQNEYKSQPNSEFTKACPKGNEPTLPLIITFGVCFWELLTLAVLCFLNPPPLNNPCLK